MSVNALHKRIQSLIDVSVIWLALSSLGCLPDFARCFSFGSGSPRKRLDTARAIEVEQSDQSE